jgi:hypothetical protein
VLRIEPAPQLNRAKVGFPADPFIRQIPARKRPHNTHTQTLPTAALAPGFLFRLCSSVSAPNVFGARPYLDYWLFGTETVVHFVARLLEESWHSTVIV